MKSWRSPADSCQPAFYSLTFTFTVAVICCPFPLSVLAARPHSLALALAPRSRITPWRTTTACARSILTEA